MLSSAAFTFLNLPLACKNTLGKGSTRRFYHSLYCAICFVEYFAEIATMNAKLKKIFMGVEDPNSGGQPQTETDKVTDNR